MSTFLGVDGGGSKTHFLLIDDSGTVLATHTEGPAYHVEIGLEALREMLTRGIGLTLQRGGVAAAELGYAFLGLPAYGEDSQLQPRLDAAAAPALPAARYRCGNDMVCGWAGALAGADGINIVAGTGSIAYGEYRGRAARAGGWGELFGDEGSAYWIAREGLRLFARMSDGRSPRGVLHEQVRRHLRLKHDLDLCAEVYGQPLAQRSQFARLAEVIAAAAAAGDEQARALFVRAAAELAELVDAVSEQLGVAANVQLLVSGSGGLFQLQELLLTPLQAALASRRRAYRFVAPRLSPHAGAALYAARLAGTPLTEQAAATLQSQLQQAAL